MARTRKLNEAVLDAAKKKVKEARTVVEIRAGLAVVIPGLCNVTNEKTAEILAVSTATVVRMQRRIRDEVAGMTRTGATWGGRRRETMSAAEEQEFLKSWEERAERGEVIVVPPIHAALEKRLERKVARSTVYRMLARHGWRKVEPDTCHPKYDPQAQGEFKKTSRKSWRKLTNPTLKSCR